METFNEETQRAKVAAGFKGGPFFKNPHLAQKMTFVDGIPAESKAKLMQQPTPKMAVENPWFSRK